MKKVIAANLILIGIGVIILELIFGSWFSDDVALYGFTKPRNVIMNFSNYLPGQPAQISYTRDKYGFRGLDNGIENIFILTVGGSTTDERFIDDGLTWQDWLEKLFSRNRTKIDVVNAGIDGQSTFGHLQNFKYWFKHVPKLKAKYILYYIGVNDFFDNNIRSGYDEITKYKCHFCLNYINHYIKNKSALHAMYVVIKSMIKPRIVPLSPRPRQLIFDSRNSTDQAYVTNYNTPEIMKSLSALKLRIEKLGKLTRKLGATPILVTQRSVHWVRRGDRIIGAKSVAKGDFSSALEGLGKLSGVDRYKLERMQARAVLEACRNVRGICVDLADEIEVDPGEDFFDAVHTTPAGSKRIAEYLYRKLAPVVKP